MSTMTITADTLARSSGGAGAPHLGDDSDRYFKALLCKAGKPVELRLKPRNKHDRNAVAVFSRKGVQIGYLNADRAPRLRALLGRTEVQATLARQTASGAWIRIALNGEVPVLSDASLIEAVHDDGSWWSAPDVYPDQVYPGD